jgi:hypothetical protein
MVINILILIPLTYNCWHRIKQGKLRGRGRSTHRAASMVAEGDLSALA